MYAEFQDTLVIEPIKKVRDLDPRKAALLSAALPGMGQIYNRKYWKLPFLYGGFAGLTYGIAWNNKWYHNYQNYYLDINDNDPTTTRYLEVITQQMIDNSGEDVYSEKFKLKKESYRRDRDFVVILTVGLYVLNILDASVDAHLSDFDVGKDLSLKIKPQMQYNDLAGTTTMGMSCRLRFK